MSIKASIMSVKGSRIPVQAWADFSREPGETLKSDILQKGRILESLILSKKGPNFHFIAL